MRGALLLAALCIESTAGFSRVPLRIAAPQRRVLLTASAAGGMADCEGGVCGRPGAGAEEAGAALRLQGGGGASVVFDVYSDPA
jgi:hypothetical protein